MREKILLCLILLLALFLRVWQLDKNPPGLYWDEASIGYNAYSLVETGKDEYGQRWPLSFESFGEFKLSGYIYTTAIFVKLLGLNEWSVRLPSTIFGTLTVLIVFFLVKELFPKINTNYYLLTIFLLAISPWHLQFSRAGFEANGALFFIVAGIYFLVKALKNPKFYWLSAVFLVGSLYFYYSGRIFLPLFLLAFFIFFHPKLLQAKKEVILSLILALLLFLPLGNKLFSSQALTRISQVSIFSSEEVKDVPFKFLQSEGFTFKNRLLHNRYNEYLLVFTQNYFRHFSPGFLFFEGDPQGRHSTRGLGMLYLWELPFLLLGSAFILKKENALAAKIVLPWILLAPVAASLALPSPHALRSLIILPTFQILTTLGIYQSFLFLKDKKILNRGFLLLLSIVIIFFFLSYQDNYWRHSKKLTAQSWADGHRELFSYIAKNQDNYDKIIVTGKYWRPYIFALFYLKYPPQDYQKAASHSNFDKFYFGHAGYDTSDRYYNYQESSLAKLRTEKNILLVLSPEETQANDRVIKTIESISGNTVFNLIENL